VRLLNFIYRTIGDRERAEDLVQETFVRVYRHLHRFDQSKKFSTWAYTIAGNLAKNELRNRSRNPLVLFQTIKKNWDADHRPLEWEDNTYRPDDLYRKRHLKEMVDNAVAQLPEHHRLVFVLREMEGKTYEEISEITGVNLGTVKSRLNRARNNFAQIIEPLLGLRPARRHFQHVAVAGVAVLSDEQDLRVLDTGVREDRQHRGRAGVADHLQFADGAVGEADRVDAEPDDAAVVDWP
jgi:RNA polymerase sigma-70 factor, ECF subfamily